MACHGEKITPAPQAPACGQKTKCCIEGENPAAAGIRRFFFLEQRVEKKISALVVVVVVVARRQSYSSRSSRELELIIPSPQAASPRGCSAASPDRGNSDRAGHSFPSLSNRAVQSSRKTSSRSSRPFLATCKGEEDRARPTPDDPAIFFFGVWYKCRYRYSRY